MGIALPSKEVTLTPLALRPRPPLGLGAALIGEEEEALVLDVLRRKEPFRYYSFERREPPPMAATLEREFAARVGRRFALAVTSGTAALECALGALGIGPGNEVIVTAWSWISCFTAIVRLGARPVLAEIDDSFSIAEGEITRLRTERTKAVLIVHYQGVAADMTTLLAEAREANIAVLEDCAQTPAATYCGRPVGSMGAIGTYSLQYSKSATCGEGGLIVTDDPLLYERAVRMSDVGQVRPYHLDMLGGETQVPSFSGDNYRITELQAAVALAQIRKLDMLVAHCRALQARILAHISDLPGLTLRHIPDPRGDQGFEIYFRLPTPELAGAFAVQLDALNVYCRKITSGYCQYARTYCQNGQAHHPAASPFTSFAEWPAPGYRAEDFPRTEALVKHYVSLSLGARFTLEDAEYIGQAVRYVHAVLMGD
ncbi:MAG TPA: DegT/DnrJ/EryC1/StrS family aminotransferase [Chthonomonadaceae bacterium]|nr:DegT/DnrJ/EryC1/StrS family aminotransferase [Chthonomonadaceae bacterium]